MERIDTPRAELRCAYCHGAADAVEPCASCGTLLHTDCRAQAGRCPTLGCARPAVELHGPTRSAGELRLEIARARAVARDRARTRLAIATVCFAAAVWVAAFAWSRARPDALVAFAYYNPRYLSGPGGSHLGLTYGAPDLTDPWGRPWCQPPRAPPEEWPPRWSYSAGPNGIDEVEGGDDVSIPRPLSHTQWIGTWLLLHGRWLLSPLALVALLALGLRRWPARARGTDHDAERAKPDGLRSDDHS